MHLHSALVPEGHSDAKYSFGEAEPHLHTPRARVDHTSACGLSASGVGAVRGDLLQTRSRRFETGYTIRAAKSGAILSAVWDYWRRLKCPCLPWILLCVCAPGLPGSRAHSEFQIRPALACGERVESVWGAGEGCHPHTFTPQLVDGVIGLPT